MLLLSGIEINFVTYAWSSYKTGGCGSLRYSMSNSSHLVVHVSQGLQMVIHLHQDKHYLDFFMSHSDDLTAHAKGMLGTT